MAQLELGKEMEVYWEFIYGWKFIYLAQNQWHNLGLR